MNKYHSHVRDTGVSKEPWGNAKRAVVSPKVSKGTTVSAVAGTQKVAKGLTQRVNKAVDKAKDILAERTADHIELTERDRYRTTNSGSGVNAVWLRPDPGYSMASKVKRKAGGIKAKRSYKRKNS